MTDNYTKFYYDNKRAFIGASGGKAFTRKFSDAQIEVYPGIFADANYERFLVALQHDLCKKLPQSETRDGFFIEPPITSDFSELLTMPGSVRKPSVGHLHKVEDIDDFDLGDPESNGIFDEVIATRYEQFTDTYGHVSTKSSCGAPFFITSGQFKLEQLSLAASSADRLVKLVDAGDLEQLYKEIGLVFLSTIQIRRQCDKWANGRPKSRDFNPLHSALQGVEARPYSSKEEMFSPSLARCRTRAVFAYAGLANNILTSVVDGYRQWADEVYAFSYKHRTRKEIEAKLNKFKACIGIDVKQFDNNVTYQMYRRWIEKFPFSDSGKKLAKLVALSPLVDTEDKCASGNFIDVATFDTWTGLPSGVYNTSAVGKDIMTYVVYKAIKKVGMSIDLKKFLTGEERVAFLNMGDDTVLLGDDLGILRDIINAIDDFQVEEELGFSFLGNIGYWDDDQIRLAPNLKSYFEGAYVPERSIGTFMRPYPMLGLALRRSTVYSHHPKFRDAYAIENNLTRSLLGFNPAILEQRYMTYPSNPGSVMTSADIEVLTNFNKLFYKFEEHDVSKDIYNLYASNIPAKFGEVFKSKLLRRNHE